MLARIWHGSTTSEKADAYLKDYFLETGLADYRATDGNQGVIVLRRDEAGQADFLMLTLWASEAAIRRFAGADPDRARYYPEDKQYFAEMEKNVAHYQVALLQVNAGLK